MTTPAPTLSLPFIRNHLLDRAPDGAPMPLKGHPPAEVTALVPDGAPGLLVIRPAVRGGWMMFLITPLGTYVYGWGTRRDHDPRVFHDRYEARATATMLAGCAVVRRRYLRALERFPAMQPGQAWQPWTPDDETTFLESWRGRTHDPLDDLGSANDVSWLAQMARRAAPVLRALDPADAATYAALLLALVAGQGNRAPAALLDEAWSLLVNTCIACRAAGMDGVTLAADVLRPISKRYADLIEGQRHDIAISALFVDPPQPVEATAEEREDFVQALLYNLPRDQAHDVARQTLQAEGVKRHAQTMAIRRVRDVLRGLAPASTGFLPPPRPTS